MCIFCILTLNLFVCPVKVMNVYVWHTENCAAGGVECAPLWNVSAPEISSQLIAGTLDTDQLHSTCTYGDIFVSY